MSQYFALKDPYFYATGTIGRLCRSSPIIDIRTKSMKRNSSLSIPFCAGNFSAAKPAATVYPNTFAPNRIADCTALFMARRKAILRSAAELYSQPPNSRQSLVYEFPMFILTSLFVILARSKRNSSISAPFRPITIPDARCEW